MDVTRTVHEDVDLNSLAHVMVKWRALANMILNLVGP